ncbi:hypothetical protein [Microbacterium laevaniformans]|uniref:hypothetical protein n=1 Tax=Microbacterium laevaniformans TaxID=36807 RepID=UPI00363C1621
MSIQDLLQEARPEVILPESERRFNELLAAAEASREIETVPLELMIGEHLVSVVITELDGAAWCDAASVPPRPFNSSDARLGCNGDALLLTYPVDHIVIGDEYPTREEWAELVGFISAPDRIDITAALWWLHIGRHEQAKADLVQSRRSNRG